MSDRTFPSEYYKCFGANSVLKTANWFCNRPLSPIENNDLSSSDHPANLNQDNELERFAEVDNRNTEYFDENSEVQTIQSFDDTDDRDMVPDYVPDSIEESNSPVSAQIAPDKKLDEAPTALNLSAKVTFGEYKQNGEIRKGKKKKDFCFYCESQVLNFARHVKRNHSLETDVQKMFLHPANSKERRQLLEVLRKKGNFLNSNNICKPVQKPRTESNVVPCSGCFGFYSTKLLWRHSKKCLGNKGKAHLANSQNLLLTNLNVDMQLKSTVFPRMRPDEISLVAKKDPLICAYGARYIKIHREKHHINVASRKMRELSRLLIELRKMDESINSLFDALTPKNFDVLVEATKTVAKYYQEKDMYESPTYALNMGTSLKQCADLAILYALKRKHTAETIASAEYEADLKTLIQIIESQWQYEVSSQAANDLNINEWNKVTLVPLANDLKLLKEFLIAKAKAALVAVAINSNNKDQYTVLLETIFCRVILLNRRRPGELQRLSLHIYEKCDGNGSTYEEFSEVISPYERILLKKFKRVVIRGKRGRGVPVLFSTDIQDHMEVLLNYRGNFVNKENLYLFGNPNSLEPVCGYKVLKKYAVSCRARNPKAITSTKLRKHLATVTQIFSMTDNDLEQLAHFMGHTIGIHKGSYRLPNDVYQTAKISKLLLLMENGGAAEFKGKQLSEIEVDMEEDLLSSNTNNDNSDQEQSDINPPAEEPMETQKKRTTEPSRNKKRVLQPWTEEQKKVVTEYFSDHIRHKNPPKKYECMILKETHQELLTNKDWLKIKVFVQNEYTKKCKKI